MSVTDLVNAAPPTDAPRAVHCHVASISGSTSGSTIARVLHTNARVREVAAPFSRAHWISCEAVFVFRPSLAGKIVQVTTAFTSDDAAPTATGSLWQEPTCTFHTGGSTYTCPPTFVVPLSFADAGTSSLVKPAPIELHRTALVFSVDITDDSGEAISATARQPVLDVFVRGQLQLGGKS